MLSPSEVARILSVTRQEWSAPHYLHQWSSATLAKLLQDTPIHVELVDERGTPSIDPFSGKRIKLWLSSVTRAEAR